VRARNRELLSHARAIVVTPFAVGPSNLANLEDLVPFAGTIPVWVVVRPPTPPWDFTGGKATQLLDSIVGLGAQTVESSDELLVELRGPLGSVEPSAAGSPTPALG
jgi:hypothetical protein